MLDFGGGDGRLMRPFVEAGLAVDLIDYSANVEVGVRKIGDTEASLPEGPAYDAIVCSHVIEHVADPVDIVGSLIQRLNRDGVLLVEVPMEIWGGPPRLCEPVTHINFFTPGSLRHLLRRAGGDVISCELDGHPHDSGRDQLVITALARRGDGNSLGCPVAAPIDTPRYLAPSLAMKLHRRLLMPATIGAAIRHRLGFRGLHGHA